ncbi:F-box only protein 16-like [Lytechinus variegatus]|uniref:F-box only protein 16-like n=1 Tax=Lytechinus variegatus TaxID=7654 RepID=UPI001BB14CCF|nr:F-box only protein 16-like [Lytechinus variegatus]
MAWSGEQKRIENKKKNLDTRIKFSSWTPMNHAPTKDKVFEERREVIQKWFDKWTDAQKRNVIADIVDRCTMSQLQYTKSLVKVQLPVERVDFTRVLPRALSLYIFSFLDPRSLCRTAQVCWYWRYLTELDQLWMPKALKLGWYLTFTPSVYETGVWKRHYLENVRSLHYLPPKDAPKQKQVTTNGQGNNENDPKKTVTPPRKTAWSTKSKPPKPLQHKPWRANAPVATDTHRNNYLDNEDELLKARQRRMEKLEASGKRRPQSAMTPDKTGNSPHIKSSSASKTLPSTQFNAKLKRARSASNISAESSHGRPDWAQSMAGGDASKMTANHIGGLDATVRPAPVLKPSRSTNALNRTERDPPSGVHFAVKGWKTVEYSDDESIG